MNRLNGKTALITGGTTGIGLATAQAFLREGARVLITGQDEGRLQKAQAELGSEVTAIRADVRSLSDLNAMAAQVRESVDGLDVLFANAGVAYFAPLEAATEEHFDSQFDINVKGLFFTVQKLAPLLKPNASVILNATFGTVKGIGTGSVYFATKAAVRSLARTWAAELGPRGIRVNCLSPGLTPTDLFGKTGLTAEQLQGLGGFYTNGAPLARLGNVEEIAAGAVFLASAESSFMTAADLVIDGGFAGV
ncbi:MAG: SDR family oxidoreductase [Bryobacterales bacterium]|nr:SDR family oxidoreductase [Bryobacterales bacterium]